MRVHPQHRERIVVPAGDDACDLPTGERGSCCVFSDEQAQTRDTVPVLLEQARQKRGAGQIRSDRIDVVPVEPERRIGKKDTADLTFREIEGRRGGCVARAFVELGAVEPGQIGQRRRNLAARVPQQDTQAVLVARIDPRHQMLRRREGGAEGEQTGAGATIHPRRKLYIGAAFRGDRREQLVRTRRARLILFDRRLQPGGCVDAPLADGGGSALAHPRLVSPDMAAEVMDDRSAVRRRLGMYGKRVGLQENGAVGGLNLVLVEVARPDARNEQLPDAARRHPLHRMPPAVPGVEGADDADTLRIRHPYRELDARHTAARGRPRAELFEQPEMLAAHEQPLVLAAETDAAKAVRILAPVRRAPFLLYEVFVIDAVGRPGDLRLVEPFRVRSMHFVLGGPFSEQKQDDALGVRHERAHGGPLPASGGLRTEDAVRHVMPRLDDPLDLIGAQGRRLLRARGQGVHAESAIRGRGRARVTEIGRRLAGHG